jgi:hypothetical protein
MFILRHVGQSRFNKYRVGEIKIVEMEFNDVLTGKLKIKEVLDFLGEFFSN